MTVWIGRQLGKVRIEMHLARGGMADVYLGTHTTLQRPVAIKIQREQFHDDPDLRDRFQREAHAIAMLRHTNIVQVFDFDTVEAQPYLVMEYVPGVSLAAYLRDLHSNGRRLEISQIRKILTRLSSAIQYAHEHGVIHRDIKSGNVILTSESQLVSSGKTLPDDFEPVLTDFGLVRFLQSSRQTATGQIAGTPAYMSPEQARGEPADERTDIYSLGIVLYEMLAGHLPFDADTTVGVLLKVVNEPPPAMPGLLPQLQEVIERALAKKPVDRYQSAKDFSKAFEDVINGVAQTATLVPAKIEMHSTSSGSLRTRSTRYPYRLPVILASALVLLLGSFFLLKPGISFKESRFTSLATPKPAELLSPGTPYAENEEKVGILRFQDGAASMDQVSVTALNMPQPPEGRQYEAWLVNVGGEVRRSLGRLELGADGNGRLAFVDDEGRNFLERYDRLEITLESNPDPNPNPSGELAYSVSLPPEGLKHVRHLLVSFGAAPAGTALVRGLLRDAILIDQGAQQILAAFQAGDEAAVRLQAEGLVNLIVGKQSPEFQDWNGDGSVDDPGDGYGMLLNGENAGYIDGVYTHADYAASAVDATENMKVHGEHVKIAARNIEVWSPQLRDLLVQIVDLPFGPEIEQPIRQATTLADEMLNGTDLNGDERVDPIPGEGGAQTAYDHAYYMADMIIFSR